jgi:hypothetical protein
MTLTLADISCFAAIWCFIAAALLGRRVGGER